MNCSFRSSEHKELRRHAKTHVGKSSGIKRKLIDCNQKGCNAKVLNMKGHAKTHEKRIIKD